MDENDKARRISDLDPSVARLLAARQRIHLPRHPLEAKSFAPRTLTTAKPRIVN